MKRFQLPITMLCLLGLAVSSASAQQRFARDNDVVRSAFKAIVGPATKSTAKIYSEGKYVSIGTVVGKKGYILTKASELSKAVECVVHGGKRAKATVIGIAELDDLALLKIDTEQNLTPIDWAKEIPVVGSWVASVGVEERPVAVGVVSVPTRKPRSVVPGKFNRGFLGVTVSGGSDNPATISRISPRSPASKAALKINDVVTHVDGNAVSNGDEMIGKLQGRQVGDTVKLTIKRRDRELKKEIRLGWFGGINQEQNTLGGRLSGRRFGFPAVFQHDSFLRPEYCGGPLLNTDGKAVGINIARVGRVSSQAIPVKSVLKLLPDLMSGKLAPKPAENKVSTPAKKKPEAKKSDKKKPETKKPDAKKSDKKKPDSKKKPDAKNPEKKTQPKNKAADKKKKK